MLRPLMNEMNLEIVMKIIQMHLWIVSKIMMMIEFQSDICWWMWSWDYYDHQIELEILGWTRLLEIVWRLLECGLRSWSSNGVGRFWNGIWDLEIIKWSWEILEWDLRSWDHQMELGDFGMWFEILRSSNGVGDCWRLFGILECGLRSWSSNGVGRFWNVIWDLEIIKWSWRFWNVVGDHDHQIESWEIVKIHHDHYWFGDCEMIVIFNKNNVVNLSIHPSIHHDKK